MHDASATKPFRPPKEVKIQPPMYTRRAAPSLVKESKGQVCPADADVFDPIVTPVFSTPRVSVRKALKSAMKSMSKKSKAGDIAMDKVGSSRRDSMESSSIDPRLLTGQRNEYVAPVAEQSQEMEQSQQNSVRRQIDLNFDDEPKQDETPERVQQAIPLPEAAWKMPSAAGSVDVNIVNRSARQEKQASLKRSSLRHRDRTPLASSQRPSFENSGGFLSNHVSLTMESLVPRERTILPSRVPSAHPAPHSLQTSQLPKELSPSAAVTSKNPRRTLRFGTGEVAAHLSEQPKIGNDEQSNLIEKRTGNTPPSPQRNLHQSARNIAEVPQSSFKKDISKISIGSKALRKTSRVQADRVRRVEIEATDSPSQPPLNPSIEGLNTAAKPHISSGAQSLSRLAGRKQVTRRARSPPYIPVIPDSDHSSEEIEEVEQEKKSVSPNLSYGDFPKLPEPQFEEDSDHLNCDVYEPGAMFRSSGAGERGDTAKAIPETPAAKPIPKTPAAAHEKNDDCPTVPPSPVAGVGVSTDRKPPSQCRVLCHPIFVNIPAGALRSPETPQTLSP